MLCICFCQERLILLRYFQYFYYTEDFNENLTRSAEMYAYQEAKANLIAQEKYVDYNDIILEIYTVKVAIALLPIKKVCSSLFKIDVYKFTLVSKTYFDKIRVKLDVNV